MGFLVVVLVGASILLVNRISRLRREPGMLVPIYRAHVLILLIWAVLFGLMVHYLLVPTSSWRWLDWFAAIVAGTSLLLQLWVTNRAGKKARESGEK